MTNVTQTNETRKYPKNGIVSLMGGHPVTTTVDIAEGTLNDHASVLKLVRTHLPQLEAFGRVGFEIEPFETAGGIQNREIGWLNESQATLLIAFMRNNPVVVEFKVRLVTAFAYLAGKNQVVEFKVPQTLSEELRLAADLSDVDLLIYERDGLLDEVSRLKTEAKERANAYSQNMQSLKDELASLAQQNRTLGMVADARVSDYKVMEADRDMLVGQLAEAQRQATWWESVNKSTAFREKAEQRERGKAEAKLADIAALRRSESIMRPLKENSSFADAIDAVLEGKVAA